MLKKDLHNLENTKKVATRDGYGKGLVKAGQKDERVVVLCADLTESTRSHWFKEKFPKRFIEVGVAEQNLVTVASGMASVGKIPFVSSYAVFSPGRNWEQIRTTVCINNMPVKIAGSHVGVSVGPDGRTHQALEDIALMRVLPNMVVLAPCDAIETEKATIAAARHPSPVYLRFTSNKTPVFTAEKTPFEIGKAQVFREGDDVTVIACGSLVYETLLAAGELGGEISVEVINSPSVKPLDEETILASARKTGRVVTVEEHQIWGGLGGAVAEFLSENYPVPVKRVGMSSFGESGKPQELREKYGLSSTNITEAIRAVLNSG